MPPLSTMLTDGIDGSISSRRVVTLAAFVLCAIAFIANLFFDVDIEKFIYDSMSYIAMAGLGATVAEKFSGAEKYVVENDNRAKRARGTPLPRQRDELL